MATMGDIEQKHQHSIKLENQCKTAKDDEDNNNSSSEEFI